MLLKRIFKLVKHFFCVKNCLPGLKKAVYLGVVHKATCKQAANLLVTETD